MDFGDRVLVRNVGLHGKIKIPDRWLNDVYVIVVKLYPSIPVFKVSQREGKVSGLCTGICFFLYPYQLKIVSIMWFQLLLIAPLKILWL